MNPKTLNNPQAAFTLVEVLAALLFLAILLPVVSEALSFSSRAGMTSERTSVATELAENQLNEMVLNNEWLYAQPNGDFEGLWPGYRWELDHDKWESGDMVLLTLKVFFRVHGKEREVALSTLVSEKQ